MIVICNTYNYNIPENIFKTLYLENNLQRDIFDAYHHSVIVTAKQFCLMKL